MAMRGPRRVPSDVAAPKSCHFLSSAHYGLPVLGLPHPQAGGPSGRCFSATARRQQRRAQKKSAALTCAYFALRTSTEFARLYTFLQLYSSKRPRDTPTSGVACEKKNTLRRPLRARRPRQFLLTTLNGPVNMSVATKNPFALLDGMSSPVHPQRQLTPHR